jgi:predicted lipoprotein with Yx(FWY)xxD motif
VRHPKIVIASSVLALAAAGGITAAVAAASPAASTPSAGASHAPGAGAATVHTANAVVAGKTEAILVNGSGLPLYYYQPDTAGRSLVSGQLAALWPPLTASAPSAAGLGGKLTVVKDAHGGQAAYNGHLLYTFVTDRPGQVTGQGVQDFFVATPGIAPLAGSSSSAGTGPAAPAGSGYGY